MKRLKILLIIVAIVLAPTSVNAADDSDWPGPIRMKNHHPLYIPLLVAPPERAKPVNRETWDLAISHSNIFLFGADEHWFVTIDKEITEYSISARTPVMDGRIEVGGELLAFYESDGFLDETLRWWHDALGVKGYDGQAEAPDNRYLNKINYLEIPLLEERSHEFIPGDSFLWAKFLFHETKSSFYSGQVIWRLPTGRVGSGYGSGNHSVMVRAMADSMWKDFKFSGSVGISLTNFLQSKDTKIALTPMATWFISVSHPLAMVTPRLELIVQSMGNTSPLPDATIHQFSWPHYEATFGFRYQMESGRFITVGISENLNKTAPDFTIHISTRW